MSVWLGVAGTNREITILQSLYIVAARSLDGTRWFIGGLFWLGHTTFIPIFCYLLALTAALIAKALHFVFAFFVHDMAQPHVSLPRYIAAIFTVFVTIMGAGAFFASTMKESKGKHTEPVRPLELTITRPDRPGR
jgi:hypothetical protein